MIQTVFKYSSPAEIIHYSIGLCSLGSVLVAHSEKGICAILIDNDDQSLIADLQKRFPKAELIENNIESEHWLRLIINFIDRPQKDLDLPLDIRGTVFQRKVWRMIQNIPLGTTSSYIEIATALGDPKTVRAVAGACAANPIALLVPCHRVVRSDGALSGYRWGIEKKRILIAREANAVNPS
jgi:AraC family transcriptional regulator, regulatory protein of adaptative response / methylated-DNA-[protein]-cysteine methyltransferase